MEGWRALEGTAGSARRFNSGEGEKESFHSSRNHFIRRGTISFVRGTRGWILQCSPWQGLLFDY